MESIHVRQRVRPIRYAFIINQDDMNAALTAVSLNTALWGGIYNPIVPLTPDAEREGLLTEFDPDEIVDLTGGSLDRELAERFQLRIVGHEHLVAADRGGKKRLGLGFDILPILRDIHEREVRHSAEPTRAALVSTTLEGGWPAYVAFAFGSFSGLPALDRNFADLFTRALRARALVFDPANIPETLADIYSPIDLTRSGLRIFTPPAGFSSHIIYIGNPNWADLVEFWNIRATGRTVLFVPLAAYERYAPLIRVVAAAGRYPINPQLDNEPDLQKAPSLDEDAFARVCEWVGTLNVGSISRRNWRPGFGISVDYYVGDIHACELEAQSGEEISIFQEDGMTPVKVISPDFLGDDPAFVRHYKWAIDITMSGGIRNNDYAFTFPYEPAVEKVIRRGFIGGADAPRLGRHGGVIIQNAPRGVLYLLPIETQAVFAALFEQVGLQMEPSQPGRYANEIINKMGHLHGDCRVFKLQGVRAVLNQLSRGGILTKGNIHDAVMSRKHWRPAFYEDIIIRSGQRGKLNFTHIFDFLLDKRVIRPGFTLRCRRCFGEDWYHVSEFNEEYTCRFCFTPQRVNFGSVHDWQYKADGLFQIRDSALGSLAVIVSLWRFAELQSLGAGRYQTSLNLRDPKSGWECEVDYVHLNVRLFETAYELVLGQAEGSGDFTEKDMENMSAMADRFGKRPWLTFSTLKESFSGTEKGLLNRLLERNYRVIALTRLELDPYHLYERFAASPHKYAVSLGDLAENTRELNLR